MKLREALKYAGAGASAALKVDAMNPSAQQTHADWLTANGKATQGDLLRRLAAGSLKGKVSFHHPASDASLRAPGEGWEFTPNGSSFLVNPLEGTVHIRQAMDVPSSVEEKRNQTHIPEWLGGQLHFHYSGLSYDEVNRIKKSLFKEGSVPIAHPDQAAVGEGTWAAGWVKKQNKKVAAPEQPMQTLDDKLPWEK